MQVFIFTKMSHCWKTKNTFFMPSFTFLFLFLVFLQPSCCSLSLSLFCILYYFLLFWGNFQVYYLYLGSLSLTLYTFTPRIPSECWRQHQSVNTFSFRCNSKVPYIVGIWKQASMVSCTWLPFRYLDCPIFRSYRSLML